MKHPLPPLVPVTPEDREWVLAVWKECPELGEVFTVGAPQFHRFFAEPRNRRHKWVGARPLGFVEWTERLDGWQTLHNIGVTKEARGTGIGRALVREVPRPVRLSTDVDNVASNAFYKALGFLLMGTKFTRSGKKLNVWEKPL